MRRIVFLLALLALNAPARAQVTGDEVLSGAPMARLAQAKDYVLKRSSSYDRTGGNADYRTIARSETLTLLDEAGPARSSPRLDHNRQPRGTLLEKDRAADVLGRRVAAQRRGAGGGFLRPRPG